MKIQLASDLHLEFIEHVWPGQRLISPALGADVLVLAGDIANGAGAPRMFADWPSHPNRIPIIYVAGNHEFYGHVLESVRLRIKEEAARNNIHYLDNDGIVIDGVRFLGATLWTDYGIVQNHTSSQLMTYCQQRLEDHYRIHISDQGSEVPKLFTAQDALSQHAISRAWLAQELAKPFDGKTVVVTHHAPHDLSVHPRYIGNLLNAAFVSDMSVLMPNVDLWLHGHMHDGSDYQVGRCRVVANPVGYILNRRQARSAEDFKFENVTFQPNLLLEV